MSSKAGSTRRAAKRFDLLGLGCVAVDDLLYVQAYPPPDAKITISAAERQCGGLTATALVSAARLGANCAYAGVLGPDELSEFAVAALRREKINLKHLIRQANARPVHSVIVIDQKAQTRNVFCDIRAAIGAHPARPAVAVIRSARVLLIDSFGLEGMRRAAGVAREANIPLVGDFERVGGAGFAELFARVDHLIISQAFATEMTGHADPGKAAARLWNRRRGAVIVTAGQDGGWYVERDSPGRVRHYPAYRVKSVDTTGCGDVFHGAYAATLAWGWPLAARLRHAAAAAALKTTRPGGQKGIPTAREVQKFLVGLAKSIRSSYQTHHFGE